MFQYWIRKKNFAWWSKFNYVASSALDSGKLIFDIVGFGFLMLMREIFRHGFVADVHFLYAASATRRDRSKMVGQLGAPEQYVISYSR